VLLPRNGSEKRRKKKEKKRKEKEGDAGGKMRPKRKEKKKRKRREEKGKRKRKRKGNAAMYWSILREYIAEGRMRIISERFVITRIVDVDFIY